MDILFTVILIMIPLVFLLAKYISNSNYKYLRSFNEKYHIDNAPNEITREFLQIGKFPYHALKEKDMNKGIEMDMKFLSDQDEFLDSLSLDEHIELVRGLDRYLTGDISSVKYAKRISKERGYKFK